MKEKKVIIAISEESKNALDRIQTKVNAGFIGGRIKKYDLASWLILNSENTVPAEAINNIRKAFRDDLKLLEGIRRQLLNARRNGANRSEMRELSIRLSRENGIEMPVMTMPAPTTNHE